MSSFRCVRIFLVHLPWIKLGPITREFGHPMHCQQYQEHAHCRCACIYLHGFIGVCSINMCIFVCYDAATPNKKPTPVTQSTQPLSQTVSALFMYHITPCKTGDQSTITRLSPQRLSCWSRRVINEGLSSPNGPVPGWFSWWSLWRSDSACWSQLGGVPRMERWCCLSSSWFADINISDGPVLHRANESVQIVIWQLIYMYSY